MLPSGSVTPDRSLTRQGSKRLRVRKEGEKSGVARTRAPATGFPWASATWTFTEVAGSSRASRSSVSSSRGDVCSRGTKPRAWIRTRHRPGAGAVIRKRPAASLAAVATGSGPALPCNVSRLLS